MCSANAVILSWEQEGESSMNQKKAQKNNFWKGFWQLADPKIWIASTVPMGLAAAMAYGLEGVFSLYWFAWTLLGIYLIEIGKNAINEYVDYQSGVDRFVAPDKQTPFSGGKKTIVQGKLTLQQTSLIAVVTMLGGCLSGVIIVLFREPAVFWIGLAGVALASFYSLPPFKFCYRGLGELAVGLTFGPLIVSGTYLVQAGTLPVEVILASLPIGLIIANVLWINQYPDVEADAMGNKQNLVVRLGKEKSIWIYRALFAAAYLSILVLVLVTGNIFWLLTFAGLPLAIRAVKVASRYYDNIPRLVEANAKTIQTYQITGAAMILAALLSRLL